MSAMIAQAVILYENHLLMVRQYVKRGDIVWNFPGGGVERHETPEEGCIREVREETGLEVLQLELLHVEKDKYTYLIKHIRGNIYLDKDNPDNDDILEVKWISLQEKSVFDSYTLPIVKMVHERNLFTVMT